MLLPPLDKLVSSSTQSALLCDTKYKLSGCFTSSTINFTPKHSLYIASFLQLLVAPLKAQKERKEGMKKKDRTQNR
jgi:hypothetical protein